MSSTHMYVDAEGFITGDFLGLMTDFFGTQPNSACPDTPLPALVPLEYVSQDNPEDVFYFPSLNDSLEVGVELMSCANQLNRGDSDSNAHDHRLSTTVKTIKPGSELATLISQNEIGGDDTGREKSATGSRLFRVDTSIHEVCVPGCQTATYTNPLPFGTIKTSAPSIEEAELDFNDSENLCAPELQVNPDFRKDEPEDLRVDTVHADTPIEETQMADELKMKAMSLRETILEKLKWREKRANAPQSFKTGRFMCSYEDCKHHSPNLTILGRHVHTHYPDAYFCPVCDTTFSRVDAFDRHFRLLRLTDLEHAAGFQKFGVERNKERFNFYFLGTMDDYSMPEEHFEIIAGRRRGEI
ncbi:hypothetical protein M0805_006307 [Coniferiporia weirii]|nr:hypothetical protein M0805_006307 [Coniferiporia weirii]